MTAANLNPPVFNSSAWDLSNLPSHMHRALQNVGNPPVDNSLPANRFAAARNEFTRSVKQGAGVGVWSCAVVDACTVGRAALPPALRTSKKGEESHIVPPVPASLRGTQSTLYGVGQPLAYNITAHIAAGAGAMAGCLGACVGALVSPLGLFRNAPVAEPVAGSPVAVNGDEAAGTARTNGSSKHTVDRLSNSFAAATTQTVNAGLGATAATFMAAIRLLTAVVKGGAALAGALVGAALGLARALWALMSYRAPAARRDEDAIERDTYAATGSGPQAPTGGDEGEPDAPRPSPGPAPVPAAAAAYTARTPAAASVPAAARPGPSPHPAPAAAHTTRPPAAPFVPAAQAGTRSEARGAAPAPAYERVRVPTGRADAASGSQPTGARQATQTPREAAPVDPILFADALRAARFLNPLGGAFPLGPTRLYPQDDPLAGLGLFRETPSTFSAFGSASAARSPQSFGATRRFSGARSAFGASASEVHDSAVRQIRERFRAEQARVQQAVRAEIQASRERVNSRFAAQRGAPAAPSPAQQSCVVEEITEDNA